MGKWALHTDEAVLVLRLSHGSATLPEADAIFCRDSDRRSRARSIRPKHARRKNAERRQKHEQGNRIQSGPVDPSRILKQTAPGAISPPEEL